MTGTNGRLPAVEYDHEAETAVLTAMFTDVTDARACMAILDPGDFHSLKHQEVFRSASDCVEIDGTAADILRVKAELEERGVLGAIGGTGFLAEISGAGYAANPTLHARRVKRLAARRKVIHAAREMSVGDEDTFPSKLAAVTGALDLLRAIDQPPDATNPFRDLATILSEPEPPAAPMFVDRLIARPALVMLYGPAQSGKSWAAMNACIDLVHGGGEFCGVRDLVLRPTSTPLGQDLNPRPDIVLWVYGSEDSAGRVESRARTSFLSGPHAHEEPQAGRFLFAKPPPGSALHTPAGMKWLTEIADQSRATVIVLDTISSLTSHGLDVNKAEHVAPFLAGLHAIRDAGGGRVIFAIHHTRKGGSDPKAASGAKADALLGAQTWRALSDACIMLDATDGETDQVVTLRSVKAKDVPSSIPSLRLTLGQDGRFRELDQDEQPEAKTRAPAAGRKPANHAETIAAAIRERGSLPLSDVPDLLDVSPKRWANIRSQVQRELLGMGFPVVDAVFRAQA